MQLHTFRIICIDHSGLFTLCLNHHAYVDWSILLLLAKEHSMSLHLPVALYCSMHFRRHILNNVISQATNKHLPHRRDEFNKHKHKNYKLITKGIVRSISYRDKLYLKLMRTPVDSERHSILKFNLKPYQSIFKRLIRDA